MDDEAYRNPSLTIDARVADLLGRMTIAEKVGQVNQRMFGWNATEPTADGKSFQLTDDFREEVARWDGMGALYGLFRADPWSGRDLRTGVSAAQSAETAEAVQRWVCENSRLGIPVLFVEEVPHGHQAIDGTILPVNLAVGSSWDPGAYEEAAARMAAEVRARGAHVALVSALDMVVDPRRGRSEECFGEDPYLAAALTQALVHGMQGNQPGRIGEDKLAVVLKHFAGQGAAIGGLNAHAAPIGPRELLEIHLPAAEAGIRAGAAGVMAAYNEIDGVPCAGNERLLTGILREDWGFDGIVMADGGGIDRLTMMTGDLRTAAVLALNAGIDLSLWDRAYTQLDSAYEEGLIDESLLDRAVARVLRLKFRLGLFDRPYATPAAGGQPPQREVSRRLAERSLVLLRNENRLLPLAKTTPTIAVIGPQADELVHQIGDYTAEQSPGSGATVLKGVTAAAGEGAVVSFAQGCGLTSAIPGGIEEAQATAADSDVVVLVLGGSSARQATTRFAANGAAIVDQNVDMTCGEGVDLADLTLPPAQLELARAVAATGTPVATVLIQGRPHALADLPDRSDAILCAWYPGTEGGTAIARALFGDVNPGGRLPVSMPMSAAVLPVAYNAKAHSHTTYVDVRERVSYPFGFGLGYTTFDYSAAELSRSEIGADDLRAGATVGVKLSIANAGTVTGSEVVQLYTRRTASSVWPRERELKGFRRIDLDPGERTEVTFELGVGELGWWLPGLRFGVERSRQQITVSGAAGDSLELTVN
ncbi:glycoside hydrolase family 3 protein [Flindersiella endophytica]